MSIGNYYYLNSRTKTMKFIVKLLGTLDLHTHIRLKPLIVFLSKYLNNINKGDYIDIIELGCGNGVNVFEIYKIAKKIMLILIILGLIYLVKLLIVPILF